MTTTKLNAVALSADRILITGSTLTLDTAREIVGRKIQMPTLQANEVADYTVQSVSQNRQTGDIVAYLVGPNGGRHARIVNE